MRWYWIDRFTELVSGKYAVATKNVTLGEDYLVHNFFNYPVMPNPLILEGMAQTAGMLMGEHFDYQKRLVLAKVSYVTYHFPARPGDQLVYRAEIANLVDDGALIHATAHVGDKLQAETEFLLAVLGDKFGGQQLFKPGDLARLVRVLGVYEVGVCENGKRLEVPQHVLELERSEKVG